MIDLASFALCVSCHRQPSLPSLPRQASSRLWVHRQTRSGGFRLSTEQIMGLGMMLDGVLRRTPRSTGAKYSAGDTSWKRFCVLTTIFGMSLGAVSTRNLDKRSVVVTANCTGEFSWMDNSLGQSPCTVAAWLLSQCAGGSESSLLRFACQTHRSL